MGRFLRRDFSSRATNLGRFRFVRRRTVAAQLWYTILAALILVVLIFNILMHGSVLGAVAGFLETCIILYCAISMFFIMHSWYRTVLICGRPSLSLCRIVLGINKVAQTQADVRGPLFSWKVVVGYLGLTIILVLLWWMTDVRLLAAFAFMFLCFGVTDVLLHSRPPLALLLASSSHETLLLQSRIEEAVGQLLVVSLLHRDTSDSVGKLLPPFTNILRPYYDDGRLWIQMVRTILSFVPIVIIDVRKVTDFVIRELELLQLLPSHRKVMLIAGEVVDARVLNMLEPLLKSDLMPKPVTFKEDELIRLMRNITRSRVALTGWLTSQP